MNKPIKIRLHVLSPIHIGCDDVYEPTSFVIDESKKKLIEFDPVEFVKSLNKERKNKLAEIANKGTLVSIIEMYRFVYSNKAAIKGYEVDISKNIVDRYLQVKNMELNEKKIKQELNNFLLLRTAYLPNNNNPYIPGSSLKGAMRTGYLSMLAYSGNTDEGIKTIIENEKPRFSITGRKNAKELEKELLGGEFATDPFRMLKVSDLLPVSDVKRQITYAINMRKSDGAIRMPVPLEVISSGSFEGVLNIDTPLKESGIKRPLSWAILSALFHKHYTRVYNTEVRLKKFAVPSIEKFKDKLKTSAFLIRLGRHSGAEAVTIEGNRFIKIMQGRDKAPRYLDSATTVWLASDEPRPKNTSNLFPFGWAVLSVENMS